MPCDAYTPDQLAQALSAQSDRQTHQALLAHLATACPECLQVVTELGVPEYLALLAGPEAGLSAQEEADMFDRVRQAVAQPVTGEMDQPDARGPWWTVLFAPARRWVFASAAVAGVALLVGMAWFGRQEPKYDGIKSTGRQTSIASAQLQAYLGTEAGRPGEVRRFVSGDPLGEHEVLYFRTHLSQPAYCAVLDARAGQVLWVGSELRPAGSNEIRAAEGVLALPGAGLPDGASLIMLASPEALSADDLRTWLRGLQVPGDLLTRCQGCALDVLQIGGRQP